MKKITMVLFVTLATVFFAFGCTRLPASQETGVGPSEYAGILNAEEIKNENNSLKEELKSTKTELEKLEKDYLSLAKNNESINSKLQEAQSKLDIVESDDIPKFNIENTEKSNILTYLNESKKLLDDSKREIDIIQTTDSKILFCTKGYGENFSQIFVWEVGKNKPYLIEDAVFDEEGSWKWLDKKYIIIEKGSDDLRKVLDTEKGEIKGSFEAQGNVYIITETSTVLIKKPKTNVYALYDFIASSEQELKLDSKNKYNDYEVNEEEGIITFNGTYSGDDSIEYTVSATMSIEKMKEIYEIKNIDETEIIEIEEVEDMLDTETKEEKPEGNAV